MSGRAEVWRFRQRLDATFKRVASLQSDPELQADLAKYLCILVSGFVETAVKELLLEHSRNNGSSTLQRYVEAQTRRLTNLKTDRLSQVLGNFNADWRDNIDKFVIDEKKDALDSVISLRNRIAHGDSVGLTYYRINNYFGHIVPIIDRIADLVDPP